MCGWWHTDKNCCVLMILAEGVDVANSMQKLQKARLQLMLATGDDKEAMQSIVRAHPYLKIAQDTSEALR